MCQGLPYRKQSDQRGFLSSDPGQLRGPIPASLPCAPLCSHSLYCSLRAFAPALFHWTNVGKPMAAVKPSHSPPGPSPLCAHSSLLCNRNLHGLLLVPCLAPTRWLVSFLQGFYAYNTRHSAWHWQVLRECVWNFTSSCKLKGLVQVFAPLPESVVILDTSLPLLGPPFLQLRERAGLFVKRILVI